MTDVTDISTAIKARYSTQFLTQLTGEEGAATTTIDDDKLEAAVTDAIGRFRLEVGLAVDTSNSAHQQLLVEGSVAFLEQYRVVDTGISSRRMANFLGALKGYREKRAFLPASNVSVATRKEREYAAMDSRQSPFRKRRSGGSSRLIEETTDN